MLLQLCRHAPLVLPRVPPVVAGRDHGRARHRLPDGRGAASALDEGVGVPGGNPPGEIEEGMDQVLVLPGGQVHHELAHAPQLRSQVHRPLVGPGAYPGLVPQLTGQGRVAFRISDIGKVT